MESLEVKRKAGDVKEELRELEKLMQQERENIELTFVLGPFYTILCCE